MTHAPTDNPGSAGHVCRRSILLAVAAASGGAFASLLPGRGDAAPGKLSKGSIGYTPNPKGAARCDACVNWQSPDGCKVVSGPISPSGWCSLFAPRT